MNKHKVLEFVQKYTMIIVLVLVTAFFFWGTGGKILMPNNRIEVDAGCFQFGDDDVSAERILVSNRGIFGNFFR